MISNNNGCSPIMNIKQKSPIKKLSSVARRGTKLAATAAHRGSQFYEQVQSRMAEMDSKSPYRHHNSSNSTSSSANDMSRAEYRSRVRDQINRFNSVAASQKSNDGNKTRHHYREIATPPRQHTQSSDYNRLNVYTCSEKTPPCNPNYYEKENESNQQAAKSSSSYSFTSKEGVRALSPAMNQQRKKSPKKASSSSSSPQKTSYSNDANNNDETEMLKKHLRELEKDNEKLMKMNVRLEHKCDKLTRDNAHLKEEVEEAIMSSGSSRSTANSAHHDNHSNNPDNNDDDTIKCYRRYSQTNKRDPDEHPLIASPLRKHMKLVHASAESNCTVTLKKAPFPLLPPEQSRAIIEARKKENEGEEDYQHLDTLGNVTCTSSDRLEVDAKFALAYKKRRGKRAKDGKGEEGCSSSSEEEEAVDLLTSAAFMFKTSRRNLG